MNRPTRQPQRRKRTEVIGEAIKEYIAVHGLGPGDRLPQESHLVEALGAAKGTIREALRGLESEGLLQTRTGPGGGAFIAEASDNRAMELLGNYFFFRPPTIHDIYEVRKQLEPTLVASLGGVLDDDAFARLEAVMAFYDHPPASL
ncbi:FadR/GntR family transcriptional regulator [Halomonas korlensis]|uniref:Regulatory protein, gntR family n=1 Tax=Halomonas korlensis TaxID=463301 RepID=A0A1I7JTR2_9GAMM|nr:GntR family transcriptional regulator [Halomonas korlensis]SFU88537.1 regulatory protein, gntR family [Halomonas korlensis]